MATPTPSQQQAIRARGNILVSAGAGTGKTKTLVERCLHWIEQGDSLEQMLLVTFTEAAAAEMKHRIRLALEERSLTAANPQRWIEEAALVETARISTLHAFCLEIVRENFYKIGLDPNLIILDESQTRPMAERALDELFERFHDCPLEYTGILSYLKTVGRPQVVRDTVWRLHRYTQSLPYPGEWLQTQIEMFDQPTPAFWEKLYFEGIRTWGQAWKERFAGLTDNPNAQRCALAIQSHLLKQEPFDDVAPCLLFFEEVQQIDGAWPKGKKTVLRKPVAKFFDQALFFQSLSTKSPEDRSGLQVDWDTVRHDMRALLEATQQFSADFSRAKMEMGGLDFSDLEQFSLKLLWENHQVSQIGHRYRAQFRHVCVDEYQDINAAQDAIIQAVSREGAEANRFLVGDLKQSIYRFRLSNPDIFRGYEESWTGAHGCRLHLSDNFRSCESLLRFVNDLFSTLMNARVGSVSYPPEASLQFGAAEDRFLLASCSDSDKRVEMHWLISNAEENDSENEEPEESLPELELSEKEAGVIAAKLWALIKEERSVWDAEQKTMRPVTWSDMVILMRTVKGRVEAFAKIFHQWGIPFAAPRPGFFSSIEVQDLLNLFRLLDNPLQDLPLLAVLRSPLFGFNCEELAQIRAAHRDGLFWGALQQYQQKTTADEEELELSGVALRGKIRKFLDLYSAWRNLIRQSSLSRCFEKILADSHYETILALEPRGAEMIANIHRLLELAHRYDPYQRQGLFRFLRFVEEQADLELDLDSSAAPHLDAVQLMSIHASKGLEFPVVVVAGLGRQFNLQHQRESILLDPELGLCPKITARDGGGRYPSLPYYLAQERESQQLRAEELRLFYVALTRARDWLILTGIGKENELVPGWGIESEDLHGLVSQSRSLGHLLRIWLAQTTTPADWSDSANGATDVATWKIHLQAPRILHTETALKGHTLPENEVALLLSKLNQKYAYEEATHEAAKTSISSMRRHLLDEESGESRQLFHSPSRLQRRSSVKLTAAERGSAHHRFLQWSSCESISLPLLAKQAEQLKLRGILSEEEVACLELEKIQAFWESAPGKQIAAKSGDVRRELPFTLRVDHETWEQIWPGKKCPPGLEVCPAGEFIVVQGVIDLAVILEKEIWLLDFKTDHCDKNSLPQKMEQYRPQLRLYAQALESIYGRPVNRRWLYFLEPGEACEI